MTVPMIRPAINTAAATAPARGTDTSPEFELVIIVVVGSDEMGDWSETVKEYHRETDFRSEDSPVRPCQTAIAIKDVAPTESCTL